MLKHIPSNYCHPLQFPFHLRMQNTFSFCLKVLTVFNNANTIEKHRVSGTLSTVSAYKIKHKLQTSNVECGRVNSPISEGRDEDTAGKVRTSLRPEERRTTLTTQFLPSGVHEGIIWDPKGLGSTTSPPLLSTVHISPTLTQVNSVPIGFLNQYPMVLISPTS